MSFKHYVIKLHMTVSCSVVQQKILNKKYSVLYANKNNNNNSFKNNNSNIAIHLHHLSSTNHRPQTSTLQDFSRRMVDMITFVGLPCSSSASSQKLGIAKKGYVGWLGLWEDG